MPHPSRGMQPSSPSPRLSLACHLSVDLSILFYFSLFGQLFVGYKFHFPGYTEGHHHGIKLPMAQIPNEINNCWFSVSRHSKQIKVKIKTFVLIKSRIWEMKGKYAKTLAKQIFEETFYPNLQRFVWRRHAGAHPDEHQHGGRKPTHTSVTEFCYKSVNLFFEELIYIKVILFLIRELFRQENSLK